MTTYTFICVAANQVAGLMDLQDLPSGGYRQHALGLLREHASAATVEVWRDNDLLEVIARAGMASELAKAQARPTSFGQGPKEHIPDETIPTGRQDIGL